MRTVIRAVALLLMLIPFASTVSASGDAGLFASWGTAQQAVATATVSNATARMIARPSLSGDRVRVKLENTFGQAPVIIGAASVGRRASGAALVSGSVRQLMFAGQASVTIPAGGAVYSDLVPLDVVAGEDVAVSMHVPGLLVQPSAHSAGFVTSYLSAPLTGDFTRDEGGAAFASTTTAIYWLAGIDVLSATGTGVVVALGASNTDGTGTRTDQYERWADILARRFQALPQNQHKGVVNAGIAGNRLTPPGGTGPAGIDRLDRDVLERTGFTHLLLQHGSNDIAGGGTGQQVIAGMQDVINRVHARGGKVVAMTIFPRNGFNATQNAYREEVNYWIRNVGNADHFIELVDLLKDPNNPNHLNPSYDNGDGIHLNPAGNAAVGNFIDLALFAPPPDLTVGSVGVSPAQIASGDLVTFTAVVANAGPFGVDRIDVRFLVDGVALAADRTIAHLDEGGSITVAAQWVSQPGMHTVQARADPADVIEESDETNNSAARTFEVRALADLTVSSTILTPGKVFGGDAVTVSATVANGGLADAVNVKVRFLIDGVPLGIDHTIARLNAGASATVTASKTWEAKHETGSHTFEVRVDPDNAIGESDESNNDATRTFTVQGNKLQ